MSSAGSSPIDAGAAPGNPHGSGQTPQAPKRGPLTAVAVTLALLVLLVWGLTPRHPKLHPAPLLPPSNTCPTTRADFVPGNLTSVPGISLDGLPPAVRNQVLLRLNLEPCSCGCRQSLAACLANNPLCAVAGRAAEAIVKDAAAASSPSTPLRGGEQTGKP